MRRRGPQGAAGRGFCSPPLARATRGAAWTGSFVGMRAAHAPKAERLAWVGLTVHCRAARATRLRRTRPLVPGGGAPIRANLCDRDRAIPGLFGVRLSCAVDGGIGV